MLLAIMGMTAPSVPCAATRPEDVLQLISYTSWPRPGVVRDGFKALVPYFLSTVAASQDCGGQRQPLLVVSLSRCDTCRNSIAGVCR